MSNAKKEPRIPHFDIYVGAPGSGKSTFLAKIAKGVKKNVLVIKTPQNIDDKAFAFLPEKSLSNWRQGLSPNEPGKFRISADDEQYKKEILPWILKENFKHGLLIVDDCSMYEANQISKPLRQLLIIRRHLGLDIALVYHGLTGCPIDQFKFTNNVVLFNTVDDAGYKAKRLAFADRLFKAQAIGRENFAAGNYEPGVAKFY